MVKALTRIAKSLGLATQADIDAAHRNGFISGWNERSTPPRKTARKSRWTEASGPPPGIEDEPPSGDILRFGYKSMSSTGRQSGISYEQSLAAAWDLWQSNPVVSRHSEIKRDYIVGGDVHPQANNDELQAILDAFWKRNQLDVRVSEFTAQLFMFGVQCLTAHVRLSDGQVLLGYVDPGDIETVIADPRNSMDMRAVVIREMTAVYPWQASYHKRVYRIIKTDNEGLYTTAARCQIEEWETELLKSYGLTEYNGDCFYVKVNAVSNQALGISDYVPVSDWCDQLDNVLFNLAEREDIAGLFTWDITVTGAKEDDLVEWRKKYKAIEKKSIDIHNENVVKQMQSPDLKQQPSIETARALFNHIWGGLGMPEAWYSRGDETNRATAQAQGDPTWRSLRHDQGIIRHWIEWMLEFARDQAILAGALLVTEDEDLTVSVQMPDMVIKDMVLITTAVNSIINGLLLAEQNGYIDHDKATEIFRAIAGELGVDLDEMTTEAVTELPAVDNEAALFNRQSWFAVNEAL